MTNPINIGMTSLLPFPELQFFSNDGTPLASGSVATFIPATSTPKVTWSDAAGTSANTNPVTLDSAGRGVFYGSGAYRFVVKDALANLIYDQLTAASLPDDAISAVMLPVVGAADLATARRLMGIDDEIAAAIAGVSTLTGPTGATGATGGTGPTGASGGAGGGYQPSALGGSTSWLQFPNINGTGNAFFQGGFGVTAGNPATANITFPKSFPSQCFTVLANSQDSATGSFWVSTFAITTTGFSAKSSSPLVSGGWNNAPIGFNWIAFGI